MRPNLPLKKERLKSWNRVNKWNLALLHFHPHQHHQRQVRAHLLALAPHRSTVMPLRGWNAAKGYNRSGCGRLAQIVLKSAHPYFNLTLLICIFVSLFLRIFFPYRDMGGRYCFNDAVKIFECQLWNRKMSTFILILKYIFLQFLCKNDKIYKIFSYPIWIRKCKILFQ